MSKKQATLFQSWGNKAKGTDDKPAQPCPQPSKSSASEEVIDLCASFEDEDDDILCEAEESATNNSRSTGQTFRNRDDFRDVAGKEAAETHLGDISIGAEGFTPTQVQTQSSTCPGFDKCAGKLWIYPTNYPVREYQFNIVQQALFKNTMVTLPTGLGKTFIAAVVMYNFYRWYPQGKVIFMAPTKPLVAQQIEACYNIMGIPQDHTAEMTGSMGPSKRGKAWHEKRVFFLTPQVLTNDLSRGSCPAHDVKCLVIDEAHKALGNHAYCQGFRLTEAQLPMATKILRENAYIPNVVRELVKYTENFRILALSATPGSDIKAVQQVLTNLLVSQIEIRTEESADIKRYSHERKVEKVVVPLGDELTKVKTRYISIMEVVVSRLKRYGVLYNKDTTSLSKFLILKAREAFRQNPPERLPRNQYGIVEGDFALAMSLYHGYELLQLHGSRSLYNFLDGILTGDKGYGRTRTELTKNADFNELMGLLSGKYTKPDGETASQAGRKPFVIGHPKMETLQEIVLDHFNTHRDATTRVMIFSQYRDSVQEITDMLHVHRPVVKVMSFIGQATAGKSTKGFTQKEQLKVMKQFREGGYNTLVSTCVGEEGLDIGDVDLIICFDAHKSPIRLVQRMGRTGRKREGRIVMLVTQGKEEQIYNQSQYSKKSIHKAILNGAKLLHFYQHSPRMLPDNYTPTCHKMHITVKENFKPTKKITCDKDLNQSKITSLMNDAASKKTHTEEVITLAEYQELEPWLVPEEDIPKLPTCTTVCLESEKTDENEVERGKFLSLSEWSPWQNTLQDTVFVDHSMASRHLVQLMEFVQLQQSLDSNEDAYGLEMAAYLNEEDILQPGETDAPSIVKFCVPKQNKNKEGSISNKEDKGGKAKSRRSDSLPKFDFLNNDSNNSSDDDLPAFNVELGNVKNTSFSDRQLINEDESSREDEENETVYEIRAMKNTSCSRKDRNEAMEISDDEGILTSKLSNIKKDTLNTFPVERKKKLFESKAKSLEKKMSVEKVRKRKKSRQISEQPSVIKLIADSDSNDFDGVPEVSVNINEEHGLEGNHKNAEQQKISFCSKEVSKHSSDHSSNVTEMIKEVKNETSLGCFRIRSPPLVENVENLIEVVGKEVDFKTFDIFVVLDEWHLENKDGKYIVYPEAMKKSFLHFHPDVTKSTHKKTPDPVVDMISTETLLQNVTGRSTKSRTSDTSIEMDPFKEKYPENVKVKNDRDSVDSIRSTNRNSDLKTLKEPYLEINNQKTMLFISPDRTSEEQKTEQSKEKKSDESLTVCDYTKTVEQEENDDFACTGNFVLNADDVLFTNDDWLDEEMEEYPLQAKQKPQAVLKYDETSPKYFDNSNQRSNKIQDIKNKDRDEQVCLCESDSILLNEGDKVDNIDAKEIKHSFVNIFPKERLNSSTESVTNDQLPMPFSTRNETNYDSFVNDKDDEIFMDTKTPVNNTQITFTQALNFVHSGSRLSGSESCSESSFKDSEVHHSKEINMKKVSPNLILESAVKTDKKLGIVISEEAKISSYIGGDPVFSENKSELVTEKTEKLSTERRNSRKSSSTSEDGVEMPEFDLGFDFDEDIIPPSPESTQISQKPSSSRLSQTFMFTHRLGQHTFAADDLASDNKDQIVDESEDDKRKDQKTNASSVTQELKSKNGWTLQNQQNAAFVKPFHGNDEESQSIIGDQVIHSVKHKKGSLGSSHFLGKAHLEPILENDFKGNKFATEEISRSYKENKNERQNQEVVKEQEHCVNNEFDASFALLGEDLDDWIDSGVETHGNTNQKPEAVLLKESVKERNDNSVNGQFHKTSPFNRQSIVGSQDRLYTPVATVSPMNLSHDPPDKLDRSQDNNTPNPGKGKLVRKSIFMLDDLPSDSFDDSMNFANDLVLDKSILKNKKCAIVQNQNTSTPMNTNKNMQIVSPCKGTETTPRKSNAEKGNFQEKFSPVLQNKNNQDYHEVESAAENDDSFIVRRKKKVQILDSPLSQGNVSDLTGGRNHCENSDLAFSMTEKKTIQLSSSGSDNDFDDSFLLKKDRVKKSDPIEINYSSDDFEEAVLQPNNQIPWKNATKKPEISVGTKEQSNVAKKVRSKFGVNRKRTSNPFIEEEAELSEEGENAASSDEHEGSDLDAYEGSFIADSQLADSQALNQTDIHALYLKSVKSPQMQRGGFKLQFNQRDDIDVYSQRPPPEESHYMEDSFCVGSSEEEDAWLMAEGDSEEESREITLMQSSLMATGRKRRKGLQAFQTSRQREIQIGRMKALSEIRSKLAGKAANRAQQKQSNKACEKVQKHKPGKRNRIQMQGDSSTDDENNFQCNTSDLMSPKWQFALNCNKRRRRVLSSDDSESEEFIETRSICKSNTNNQLTSRNEGDRGRNLAIASTSFTSSKVTAEEIRQERLKKQKVKQAEFKRLLEKKKMTDQIGHTDQNSTCTTSGLTKIKEKSEDADQRNEFEFAKPTIEDKSEIDLLLSSSVRKSKFSENPKILVDSKEVSGSQDIISDLRFKHGVIVSAAQLPGCDYIVSNRMAVERKQWSEFSNGANRSKLIERMQHLGELYDRPCLIVEKDRVKPGEEKSTRPVHWTKYVDRTLALLLRSEIKVMFTDNHTETAGVLADLCRLEQRKNMTINVPVDLNDEQLHRVKFFLSIPKLSYIHALNLCDGFRSVAEFIKSSIALIEKLGKMSRNRATEVYNYLRRQFDPNMLPSSYK